jgi:hypothetical protein
VFLRNLLPDFCHMIICSSVLAGRFRCADGGGEVAGAEECAGEEVVPGGGRW